MIDWNFNGEHDIFDDFMDFKIASDTLNDSDDDDEFDSDDYSEDE